MPTRPLLGALGAGLLASLTACGGGSPPPPTPASPVGSPSVNHETPKPLFTPALAGQSIAVLPLSLVFADTGIGTQPVLADRAHALAWADSLIGSALEDRAPEATWVLPAELRKAARRAPGIAPDPDHMGQAIMRAESFKEVPDPLRSEIRSLVALVGGRYALIPASLGVLRGSAGQLRAELSMVLADARTGTVLWRSRPSGEGTTPDQALNAALASVLPAGLGMR